MIRRNEIFSLTALVFALLCLFSYQSNADEAKKQVNEGNKQYKNKKFNEAEINYRKAIEEDPANIKGSFNLGDAIYKQGNYEDAAKHFATVANLNVDNDTKAKIFHNLGNSFLQAQKFPESIQAYKNALKLNPKDMDTKYNLQYAREKMIQQQQQQQNKDQNKDKKDQDKKDQDKKEQDKEKQDQQKQDQQKQDQQDQNKDQQDQKQGDNKDQKQDQQKQDQQQKDQKQGDDKDQQQAQQGQRKDQKISDEEARRILQALQRDEKNVLKKLQKQKGQKKNLEKNW